MQLKDCRGELALSGKGKDNWPTFASKFSLSIEVNSNNWPMRVKRIHTVCLPPRPRNFRSIIAMTMTMTVLFLTFEIDFLSINVIVVVVVLVDFCQGNKRERATCSR